MMGNRFLDPQSAAEKTVSVIGFGYGLSADLQLSGCKPGLETPLRVIKGSEPGSAPMFSLLIKSVFLKKLC